MSAESIQLVLPLSKFEEAHLKARRHWENRTKGPHSASWTAGAVHVNAESQLDLVGTHSGRPSYAGAYGLSNGTGLVDDEVDTRLEMGTDLTRKEHGRHCRAIQRG